MRAETYYSLDVNDREYIKRLGECLNMIGFVFTHFPELRIVTKEERKKTHAENPHGRIFNGNPFTAAQLHAWRAWVDAVVAKGTEAIPLQHPAYRSGHCVALQRFREEADAFIRVWQECNERVP